MPENMIIDMDRKHPLYADAKDLRKKAATLYAGQPVIKEKTICEKYLFKTQAEDSKDYDYRLKRAVYFNYLYLVEADRMAMLFKRPHTLTLPAELEQYTDDVDGQGTSIHQFRKRVVERAEVEGLHFIEVDKGRAPINREGQPEKPTSRAQEDALNMRPFMRQVFADDVIDWQLDHDGNLEWVVMRTWRQERKGGPGSELKQIEQRKVWTKTAWEFWEKAENVVAAGGEWKKTLEGPNDIGVVPLVPFYGWYCCPMHGQSVLKDILDHVISLYNKFSDRDWFEFKTNNPIPYVISATKPSKMDANGGFWVMAEAERQAEVGWLEVGGTGSEASRLSEKDLIQSIYEIALRQAKKDTAQVQSADTQREDRNSFSASLQVVSLGYEYSEYQVWELMAQWQRVTGEIEVEWSRDFDDKTIDSTMLTALSGLETKRQFPLIALLQKVKDLGLLPEDEDVEALATNLEGKRLSEAMVAFNQFAQSSTGDDNNPDEGRETS